MHIQELAKVLGAEVAADADLEITGAATIRGAGPNDITFLSNKKYRLALRESNAGAVLVPKDFDEDIAPILIRTDDPYLGFARVLEQMHRYPEVPRGVHPTAVLGKGVELGTDVAIGPYVVIGDGVRIGEGTAIHPHVVVYEGAQIGPGCVLHSFSVVREKVVLGGGCILQNGAIVGADGFGFAQLPSRAWHKIPQAGTVVLAEDVEVQANACVDRATIGSTTVGRGTKLDNLAQVGHGCSVGEDTLLCGQVGLAGSSDVGSRAILGGQVGVAGHCSIGDDVAIAAQSGTMDGPHEPGAYGGRPPVPISQYMRWVAVQGQIPDLFRRVKRLEKKLAAKD